MPGMINYIFKSIHVNENAIENIQKMLKQQAKLNRSLVYITGLTVACLYIQDRQIKKLTDEVKELKRAEAEGE